MKATPRSLNTTAVNIIGVGNMGGAMAERLASCGGQVWVHDLRTEYLEVLREKIAKIAVDSARAAIEFIAEPRPNWAESGLTLIAVVDANQTRDVLFGAGVGTRAGPEGARGGLAAQLQPGHTVMLCPTIAPNDVRDIAANLAERGVHTLDAPMSGGPERARRGLMSLMVAGPAKLLARHRSTLDFLAQPVVHVGHALGDAAATKLVNNLLAAIQLAGAAEATALAERLGLNAERTWDVIEASSGQSWIGSHRMRRALAVADPTQLAPLAHTSLLAKDSALAMALTSAQGNPMGAAAAQVFQRALAMGLGDRDDACLLSLARTQAQRG